jgi:glycogen debranching enzyme
MAEPWTTTTEPATPESRGGPVTIVEGSTFCLSGRGGDMRSDLPEGLFFLDTRLLSRWQLRVDGVTPQPLAVAYDGPYGATFVSRAVRDRADGGSLLVMRRRLVGRGMREDLSVRHHGRSAREVTVALRCDVDFADLFDVKRGEATAAGERRRELSSFAATFHGRRGRTERRVRVAFSAPPTWDEDAEAATAVWRMVLEPEEVWTCCAEVSVAIGESTIEPRHPCGEATAADVPSDRFARWRAAAPRVRTDDPAIDRVIQRSLDDLGSLRMFDPAHPERPVVAAGAPWFMTLFGRDSIITAWMTLLAEPDIALGVLQALARLQGTDVDAATEEEPGKILHEVRFGESSSMSLGDGHIYYGSIDATPLFVMLIAELGRWGHEPAAVDALIPAADRALAWIEQYGDRDGDGYVEYARMTPRGLRNQGWKDSWDGIPSADGRLPETPIALCEVQGYVYGAYVARAELARWQGDTATETAYRAKAAALRSAFERDFWLPDKGWYALGLDAQKRPIDALASNMGHCLWTGIVEPQRAELMVPHLLSGEMFSGWGVRTLASSMASYDPLSYHAGSVWPHDNAILAAGLMRYGFVQEAHRIILAMFDAAASSEDRLPELFAGVSREEVSVPVAYPSSCSPQAWAAAAPLLLLRAMLGLEPDVRDGVVAVRPRLPDRVRRLAVDAIPLAGQRVSFRLDAGRWALDSAVGLRVIEGADPVG